MLNEMMYSSPVSAFDAHWFQFNESFSQYDGFIRYFDKQWIPKAQLWVKVHRMDATFETNNFVESYHSKLKGKYLGKSRNLHVDRILLF
ncbi:hypothetical protein BC941DRAFT_440891 [Chlamydoabsidia padenii]|nr:hypothetical protein BC941DRAFT_440891 [Chlamydoabsidia padenii]